MYSPIPLNYLLFIRLRQKVRILRQSVTVPALFPVHTPIFSLQTNYLQQLKPYSFHIPFIVQIIQDTPADEKKFLLQDITTTQYLEPTFRKTKFYSSYLDHA